MKIVLFIITFFFRIATSFSQQPNGIAVKMEHIPFPEKIIVKIHSETTPLDSCQFKMINSKGIVVKTLNFYNAKKDIEATILTEDLEYGEYVCLIMKDNKQIYKENIFKDFIYMDSGIPVIIKVDSTKK